MKNKTTIEWLEIARANGANWVDQALENIAAQPDFPRDETHTSLSAVVIGEFFWDETPKDSQGVEYWNTIYSRLRYKI